MSVLQICETTVDDTRVYVEAIVDDMLLVFQQTMLEPAEYAPGLCSASFLLDPEESIPLDEDGFLRYVDDLDLDWQLVDVSDMYVD